MNSDKLIVALDVPNMAKVRQLVEQLDDSVSYYKVGMELFYGVGIDVVRYLKNSGKSIFVDLKMHDIPNTVAQGASMLTKMGMSMLNVHALGGAAMMKGAAEAVANTAASLNIPRPKLIAVTVLTSMNDEDWDTLNYKLSIPEQVVLLAKMAQDSGLDGVVASPQEAALIRKACGDEFLIVTPGVRPQGAESNDQSRIATPAMAMQNGATHLVVGRPITKAANPRAAAEQILKEMGEFA